MHLPSAGMIRFRFDGFAGQRLSPDGAPRGIGEITAVPAQRQDPLQRDISALQTGQDLRMKFGCQGQYPMGLC